MDLIGRINTLIWAWIQCLRSGKRISIFFPFFLFVILQLFALAILIWFHLPPFAHLLIPLMEKFFGEPALHFPHHYIVLPQLYGRISSLVLNPLTSWLFIGMATVLFASFYRGRSPRPSEGLKIALRLWRPLLLVGLAEFCAVTSVMELFKHLAGHSLEWSRQSPRLFSLVVFLLHIVLVTPFAFTSAHVVLGGRAVGGALRGSFSMARMNFWITFLMISVPSLISFVINHALLSMTPRVVTRLNPAIGPLLLLVSIAVTMVINFFIVGSLTALYLSSAEMRG